MQAETNMRERIAQAYRARRDVRLLCIVLVLGAASALFLLADGFPPFAWRLLAQTLPNIPALLAARGAIALLALSGLVLLSLTLLFAWWGLLWLATRMLTYWWYERQELRVFAADAAEAHYRAEKDVAAHAPGPFPRARTRGAPTMDRTSFVDEGCGFDKRGCNSQQGEREGRPAGGTGGVEMTSLSGSRYYFMQGAQADEWMEDEDHFSQNEQDDDSDFYDNGTYDEGEEESELSFYTDDENDEVCWEEEDDEAPWAEQRTLPMGAHTENIQQSSYGRILPFAPVLETPEQRTANLFRRTSLLTVPLANMPQPATISPTPEPVPRPPALQLVVSTGLDAGLKRRDRPNEDSLLALQNTRILRGCACPVGLFVIADGMGGHENGQEASRLVIQSLSKTVVPSIIYGPTDDNYAELLAEGAHHANLAVYQRNRQEKADMGTTLAAALVVDTTVYVVNAGDSRVYLYRAASGLSQVTRDHSTVARLVENGIIQPEEIYTHPRRNEIYRSLGHHPSEDLDNFILALQPEDLLLLCSDGLWEMVRDDQIEQIIAATLHQPTQISASLVQAALEGGGKDNISVIVVYAKAVGNSDNYCNAKSSA